MHKKTAIQYILGLGLALLTIPILEGTFAVLPDIGWHFITVFYIIILVLQIIFYYLTTNFKFGLTSLSFLFNFVLWLLEQVLIEKNFHDSFIYKGANYKIGVFILGGLLWVTNKILIDKLFGFNKSIYKKKSKINL